MVRRQVATETRKEDGRGREKSVKDGENGASKTAAYRPGYCRLMEMWEEEISMRRKDKKRKNKTHL